MGPLLESGYNPLTVQRGLLGAMLELGYNPLTVQWGLRLVQCGCCVNRMLVELYLPTRLDHGGFIRQAPDQNPMQIVGGFLVPLITNGVPKTRITRR
jgi:hypothetical protein